MLEMADERLYMIPKIKERRNLHFGHVIRRNSIHMQTVEGPLVLGKITRGNPRMKWMTNIKEWTGMRYEELMRTMDNHDSQPS